MVRYFEYRKDPGDVEIGYIKFRCFFNFSLFDLTDENHALRLYSLEFLNLRLGLGYLKSG